MQKNTISELRDELFNVLRGINDKDNPVDINKAKASAEVAQVIINSVKMEIEFYRASGKNVASEFIPQLPEAEQQMAESIEMGTESDSDTDEDNSEFDYDIESPSSDRKTDRAGGTIIRTDNGYVRKSGRTYNRE